MPIDVVLVTGVVRDGASIPVTILMTEPVAVIVVG